METRRRRTAPRRDSSALLRARDELLEPRVIAQRIEVGVDLQPGGREDIRDLQQLLEVLDRLLVFPDLDLDANELMQHVRAGLRVPLGAAERNPACALA